MHIDAIETAKVIIETQHVMLYLYDVLLFEGSRDHQTPGYLREANDQVSSWDHEARRWQTHDERVFESANSSVAMANEDGRSLTPILEERERHHIPDVKP